MDCHYGLKSRRLISCVLLYASATIQMSFVNALLVSDVVTARYSKSCSLYRVACHSNCFEMKMPVIVWMKSARAIQPVDEFRQPLLLVVQNGRAQLLMLYNSKSQFEAGLNAISLQRKDGRGWPISTRS